MKDDIKKRVIDLYKSGNAILKVAEITGIHKSSVWRACKKAGVMRTTSEASEGKILSKNHKENISKGIKESDKCRLYHLSQRKKLKEGYKEITKELAYIAGVLITDGYVSNYMIGLESIDKGFVELFAQCCEKQFGITLNWYELAPRLMTDPRIGKQYQTKKRYMVRFGSKNLEEFCRQINANFIRRLPDNLKLHALRGMWDGDGCYSSSPQVLFYNRNKDIINLYEELLNLLGVSGRYYKQSNGVFKYYFGRQAQIKKFFNAVTPVIKRKKVKIDADIVLWN